MPTLTRARNARRPSPVHVNALMGRFWPAPDTGTASGGGRVTAWSTCLRLAVTGCGSTAGLITSQSTPG